MQELLNKNIAQNNIDCINKPLSISQIEKFYLADMKTNLKIGLEYERLSLDKNTLLNANYESIAKIIEHFASIQMWDLIYDDETIIGAKDNNGTSISLEPGCQFEISLAPKENVIDIDIQLSRIVELLDKIANIYDIIFVGYGITPKSNVDDIKILNKRRYKIMNEYLPKCSKGNLCPKMMRQTAGIQVNVDYKNNKDAYIKLKLFNIILPFISGLCSNSPIEENSLSAFKSIRNNVWRFTGENRCNLFYKKIFNKKLFKYKNFFKNYINEIFDVPMVFIEREDYVKIMGDINFGDFVKNGYKGYMASYDDYINHQSLCFPDVRLKNYIEIRNHDSNSPQFALALCALYKGICLGQIEGFIKELNYLNINQIDKYYELSSVYGLDFELNNISAWEIMRKIVNFSAENLNSKERCYLEPILMLLDKRKTPADILIDFGIDDAKSLVEFL